jgi:amicyanin
MVMPAIVADGPSRAVLKATLTAIWGLAAILAIMSITPSAHAEETTVKIDNFTFNPPSLTVKAGTTVTWKNEDDIPHTVASATKVFKSKALDTDDSYTFTFTTPGVYEYFCSIHPHMTAKIVVEAKTGSN